MALRNVIETDAAHTITNSMPINAIKWSIQTQQLIGAGTLHTGEHFTLVIQTKIDVIYGSFTYNVVYDAFEL